ncbi:imidazole glycerol phosphate synthase subunit HisH [Roseimaritima sediminicola]|uniref:imidazole glycerol phosphate synthase subunit HisH n=1 Tax=Roseimaritima sediminicola TaxID=2662066 RepID=UPI0012984131|nr:imidazole glycerol phosphate synthase subunit HisH [Roseimaritima sediminicola]
MITIVDYQMGNLRSVQKAIERVGLEARISSDGQEIATAEKLILPGVGGFGDAMAELGRRDLVEPIRDFIATDRPFLGICLGLQLLFEKGYEGGCFDGLGVLGGEVVRFERAAPMKVPHMGWNTVRVRQPAPVLGDDSDGAYFYFVHSYYVVPSDPSVIALSTDYGGEFCSMVRRGNLYATQFHPEKSQANGLRLLERFARLPTAVEHG